MHPIEPTFIHVMDTHSNPSYHHTNPSYHHTNPAFIVSVAAIFIVLALF